MPDEMNQQPFTQDGLQEQTPLQQTPPQPYMAAPQTTGTSGMGIASLVLGILAILTSFLPIINNGSFFLALLGLIFAVVGIIATKKGKKGGKGIAIAGLVLNILSIVIVLATQSMYSAAINSATEELERGEKPVAATQATNASTESAEQEQSAQEAEAADANAASEEQAAEENAEAEATAEAEAAAAAEAEAEAEAAAAAEAEVDYSNMAIGDSVEFRDGLSITVDGVITGLSNYDGSPVTGITVTYANNGEKNQSFNPFDWKAQDVNGIIDSQTFYMEGENELSSGELTPGSTVTGNIYFDGELAKALYYSNIFQSNSEVAWNLQ